MLDIPTSKDLAFLSVRELTDLFMEGTATPVDATEAAIGQIDAHNEGINAFSFVDRRGAVAAAEASAKRWRTGTALSPIDGIPTTIKDVMMVQGWETSFGSRVLGSREPSDWSSPAVSRLLEAGAVLIGQTLTPEIGWKGITDNTLHGMTRNPWNSSQTPGGSSGGAGAAAAMGAGVLHVGTDGGGSIRIPAAFCGIFGHKPSYGRVPAYPPSPYSTLAHVGPMTRRVEDAAMMLSVMSRPDSRDWHALPYDQIAFEDTLSAGIEGKRISFSPDFGQVNVHPEVAECVRQAIEVLASLGAVVEEVSVPFAMPGEIVDVLWFSGIASRVKHLDDNARAMLDPGLLEIAKRGDQVELSDYHDAMTRRAEFGRQVKQYFEHVDFLVTPTVPMPAFAVDEPFPDLKGRGWSDDWMPFTYPFNLTQQPASSVPCGFTRSGLPVGLQIVGAMHNDESVLQAAYAYEQAAPTQLFPAYIQNKR